jgi:hypothetical protein
MIPFQLRTINDYAVLPSHFKRIAVFKPRGLEVYITPNGDIFDFEGQLILNNSLLFLLDKARDVAKRTKSLVFGVLTSNDPVFYQNLRWAFTAGSSFQFLNFTFKIYDIIYPYFSAKFKYKLRIDQVEAIFKKVPYCDVVDYEEIGSFSDLNDMLITKFNPFTIESVYIYNASHIYRNGVTFNKRDACMYEIRPTQKFRTHIKHIIPKSTLLGNGKAEQAMVASAIVAKVKKELLEIPIIETNLLITKGIWDRRNKLKNVPFWFTGFTVFGKDKVEIVCKKFDKFIL